MLLSEAITYGSTLRKESHDGPFVRIANTEELRGDVWGAACEAVHSLVAKRNWNKADADSYARDIEYLRQIQQQYFADYCTKPATCPGAKPRTYAEAGGRFTGRVAQGLNEVAIEGERQRSIAGITTACPAVTNLAELIEHMFYVHNWAREECGQAVHWYEEVGGMSEVERNFEHYQSVQLRQSISQRLTTIARQREQQRRSQRRIFAQ